MATPVSLVSVVGARPQFVKLAPIVRAVRDHKHLVHHIVHTGQHYDDNMSGSFFDELELPRPDIDLGVGSGSHAQQTGTMLSQLEAAFLEDRPDAVLVYGDTNSTLAATLAATKIHVPVAHIEAGLRSFNRMMPEEINRLVADHCADRLYAPTPQALRNLADENLASRSVLTGDVMLDAIKHNIKLAATKSSALEELGLENREFGVVTVHRPVNTSGDALRTLLDALETTSQDYLPLVFPVHPRTRAVLDSMQYVPPESLTLIDPLPYLDCIWLIQAAAIVITDSGGVQKEAAILQTPCLTMRGETEWTETLEFGVNKLVGDSASSLVASVAEILERPVIFSDAVLVKIEEHYGDGNAATLIVNDCLEWLSQS